MIGRNKAITTSWLQAIGLVEDNDVPGGAYWTWANEPDPSWGYPGLRLRLIGIDTGVWTAELIDGDRPWHAGVGFGEFSTRADVEQLLSVVGAPVWLRLAVALDRHAL